MRKCGNSVRSPDDAPVDELSVRLQYNQLRFAPLVVRSFDDYCCYYDDDRYCEHRLL